MLVNLVDCCVMCPKSCHQRMVCENQISEITQQKQQKGDSCSDVDSHLVSCSSQWLVSDRRRNWDWNWCLWDLVCLALVSQLHHLQWVSEEQVSMMCEKWTLLLLILFLLFW